MQRQCRVYPNEKKDILLQKTPPNENIFLLVFVIWIKILCRFSRLLNLAAVTSVTIKLHSMNTAPCLFVCLFGFLTSSSTTRLYRGRAPRQERLTILRAATHETELGDHDFCLSRSHYTDTDPTCRERAAAAGIEPGTSSPGVARSTAELPRPPSTMHLERLLCCLEQPVGGLWVFVVLLFYVLNEVKWMRVEAHWSVWTYWRW